MSDNNDKTKEGQGYRIGLSADSLKGKQSVRATFKLPAEVIELLSIAASQLGLKQKSLFDQLMEDRDILAQVARQAAMRRSTVAERRQKTYVLSRNSLVALDAVARGQKIPRDILVEVSIQRLQPVINAEKEKQKKRKAILAQLEDYFEEGLELLGNTEKDLSNRDPVYEQMEILIRQCQQNLLAIRQIVDQGRCLEEYE